MLHAAYGAGLEQDATSGAWRVADASEPLWAESNWPNLMYAKLYPYGAPRVGESLLLLGVGAAAALVTYASVYVSRARYKQAYKRL